MGVPAVLGDWVSELETEDLGSAITQLSAQINAVNSSLLQLIAEFDRSGGWREQGAMRTCAHWLAANCGIQLGAAREKVRVARQLQALPRLSAVFAEGELSYSKVRAVTRVATGDNEGFLLQLALENSAGHLEKLLSRFEPVPEPGLEGLLERVGEGFAEGRSPGGALTAPAGGIGQETVGSNANVGSATSGGLALPATVEREEAGLSDSTSPLPLASSESDCADLAGKHACANPAGAAGDETDALTAEDAELDPELARELARKLYWFQDKDGMWVIHAKLPPEQGQLVIKALQAIARPLEEERREAWKAEQQARMQAVARKILSRHQGRSEAGSKAELTAEAGADSATGAVAPAETSSPADLTSGHVTSADIPSIVESPLQEAPSKPAPMVPNHIAYIRAEEKISAERFSQHMDQVRADAMVAMVEHFLASGPDYSGLQSLKGAERCQVVMHVDVNTLREQRSGVCCTHGRAHFEDKPWLSPTTARRLSCDASLVTVLEDDAGKVLNVGRRSRIVPAPIRRALRERDGVCQYPGCQESEYVDAHHIHHWADGGETRLDNLVTLCRFHHRRLHQGCFDIRLNGASAEVFWPGGEATGAPGSGQGWHRR
ncbi:MAG: hypothetical protein CME40_15680 [Haliea sp.]|nr:hypothetical protein [Haliea sp.]|tara:strand:- start:82808 stop:84631 length:1824 start_codon:yes stop_codon:yes gene_type:complete